MYQVKTFSLNFLNEATRSLLLFPERACKHALSLSQMHTPSLPPSLSLSVSLTRLPSLHLRLCLSFFRPQSRRTSIRATNTRNSHSHQDNKPYVSVYLCVCICMQGHRNPLKFCRIDVEGLFGLQQVSSLSYCLSFFLPPSVYTRISHAQTNHLSLILVLLRALSLSKSFSETSLLMFIMSKIRG